VPSCKILLIWGHATTLDLQNLVAQGRSFEVLLKPIHPGNLLSKLEEMKNS